MSSDILTSTILFVRNNGAGMMDYWFDPEKTLNRDLSKFLNTPRFTAGELPVSYRVLSHWDKLGILPGNPNKEGAWRKFTFIERVWIGVVVHLREFGFSLKKIAQIKNNILDYNNKLKAYVYFEYYIARAISSSEDPYVLVLANGLADVGTQEEIEINKIIGKSKDMVLISLKSVLEELDVKVKQADSLIGLRNQEMEVISAIRGGDFESITAKLKDNEVIQIDKTAVYHGKTEIEEVRKSLEEDNEYFDILMKNQGKGEEVAIVTRKVRPTK